ncbi:hypothetical protein GCM10010435_02170 [Winogradskya consettensis]|uniref:Uncharacterized protein n=1 Tax=Winogradskya consettensis TaxID=113560 RepID=A0A919S9G4_9ACTN|nr:hypothetical protein [Actinoplanes consettensis]GIM66177.1 hypothetical protein Aco04nite_00780 [Actinoplanes consettensis]
MLDTDTRTAPLVDEDEPKGRFNRRRMIRVVTILTIGILAVLAVWQDPLYAGH